MKVAIRPAVSLFLALATLSAVADPPPRVQFGRGHVDVREMHPGTLVCWMALVRERIDHHIRVSIHRGTTRAGQGGEARVADPAADARRAVWAFAPVDDSGAVVATAPGYEISPDSIETTGRAGDTFIRIVAPEVHVLYVRPPAGAWYYDATDGSDLDGDRMQNGTVEVPLSALQRLDAGPKPPPAAVESGDYVLVIDPRQLRTAKVVVP